MICAIAFILIFLPCNNFVISFEIEKCHTILILVIYRKFYFNIFTKIYWIISLFKILIIHKVLNKIKYRSLEHLSIKLQVNALTHLRFYRNFLFYVGFRNTNFSKEWKIRDNFSFELFCTYRKSITQSFFNF